MITHTSRSGIPVRRDDIPLTDREITKRYLGIDRFPCSIVSPLREDDIRPSFSMQERGGSVLWKDFGTGAGGNIVKLMSLLWHVTYSEALLKMKLDVDGRIPRVQLERRYDGTLKVTGNSILKVKIRDWLDRDSEYWESYGIPVRFAAWCNVYPVSHAIFTTETDGRRRTTTVPMDRLAYAYFEWKDGKESIKLYQPYSATMKWVSKHSQSVWDLWKQAFVFAERKSDAEVIITSSRKDAMCLWYNLGVPAMSLQGEGYLPKPQVMRQVLDRFKTVYLWYDNDFKHKDDNPGQDNAAKLVALYPSLRNICIPSELGCKDPSDLVKTMGVPTLIDVWKQQKQNYGL